MKPLLIMNTTKDHKEIEQIILNHFPNSLTETEPDFIISVGGDGTVLQTIKNEGYRNVPFFSIANGTLNFIPENIKNLDICLEKIKNGTLVLEQEKTFYLNVTLKKHDGIVKYKAVNDVVLGNGIMDFFHFKINSDDPTFKETKISAGGICVSTPLGSTAYHYNNEGAIIPSLNLPLLGISSIVANRKEKFNKFISANQTIEISLNQEKENRNNCLVFIDGKTRVINLEKDESILIEKGEEIIFLFTNIKEFEIKRLTF